MAAFFYLQQRSCVMLVAKDVSSKNSNVVAVCGFLQLKIKHPMTGRHRMNEKVPSLLQQRSCVMLVAKDVSSKKSNVVAVCDSALR